MTGPWYVYDLVVPVTGFIAYVGMTQRPRERLSQHKHDPASSANHLFDREDGHADPIMVLIKDFLTREEARLFEATLIAAGVGCSGKEYQKVRMWHRLRELIGDEKGEEIIAKIYSDATASPDKVFDQSQIKISAQYVSKTIPIPEW